ncbi:hypothetical protein [Flagellimonas sp. S3867]|uniref:TapB family protein n=1 Tax=Flagellimonas sp. S3867 TaxID=2768063 RepID=UPI001689A167|nr:hypothetical protein [Flagellimonas sp. S3867]
MKKIVLTISLIALIGGSQLWAQGKCSKFYPLKEGAHFTLTIFDQDSISQGTVTYKVDEVTGDSGRYTYSMAMGNTVLNSAQYTISCTDDGVDIDFSSMGGGMLSRYSNMDVDIAGTNIYIPNDLSVGRTLPDATMDLRVSGAPGGVNISMKMTNRKVEGTETIIDPNGEPRECFILSYDLIMNMGTTIRSHAKQWLAEDVGLLKTKDFDVDGGTLRGLMVLTSYEL